MTKALSIPLCAVLALPGLADDPPARGLSQELASEPRLTGTVGAERSARWVAGVLVAAGWDVRFDRREVLLSLPRRLAVTTFTDESEGTRLYERIETFDPDAEDPGDVPPFNAWSKSDTVFASVLDAGRGLRADFEALLAAGIETKGRIALARYGGSYRGVKVELAEEFGCVGVLLFSDPKDDGAEKGPTWPDGPWKPGWAAQRGSIVPISRVPGDPSTPGWASAEKGKSGRRLSVEETAPHLPQVPCLPVGTDCAMELVRRIANGSSPWARIEVDAPRTVRPIVNVIARLPGLNESYVLAGNHRDAWVRGAQDAGSGTVALLRAAQRLGARAATGWRPRHGIALAFWDAEEQGLIGSTEWAEANAGALVRYLIAYVNADAVIGGPRFRAGGTPGLLEALRGVLEEVDAPDDPSGDTSLWDQWSKGGEREPSLGLPGSGSDFAVFLHHLGLPILDFGFGGNGGGQYHTSFDDFENMDRHIDPGWHAHEAAGEFTAKLLEHFAEEGRSSFDGAGAARTMAQMVRDSQSEEPWLGTDRTERLASSFEALAVAIEGAGRVSETPSFYRALRMKEGLPDRPWFTNRWWAPGLETGYSAETLPALRTAARAGEEALEHELSEHLAAVDALRKRWLALTDGKELSR